MGASVEADNKLENIFLDDGRGSCYGIKPNVDVVEQSCSKGVNCSEMFRTRGSLSVTKLSTSRSKHPLQSLQSFSMQLLTELWLLVYAC